MIVYYRGEGSWYDLIKRKKNDFIKVQLTESFHVNGLFSIDVNAISDITYDKKTSVSLLLPCELEIDKRITFSNAKNLLAEIPKKYSPENPYFKLASQLTITEENISNVLDALKNISIRKKLSKQISSNKTLNYFINENNFSLLKTLTYREFKQSKNLNPKDFGGHCMSIKLSQNKLVKSTKKKAFTTEEINELSELIQFCQLEIDDFNPMSMNCDKKTLYEILIIFPKKFVLLSKYKKGDIFFERWRTTDQKYFHFCKFNDHPRFNQSYVQLMKNKHIKAMQDEDPSLVFLDV